MARSINDKNEVVTDGVYFLSALLGDPNMNDSKLMIVLSVCLCAFVRWCRLCLQETCPSLLYLPTRSCVLTVSVK